MKISRLMPFPTLALMGGSISSDVSNRNKGNRFHEDRSRYTGAMLRKLRAARGVGRPPRVYRYRGKA